VCSLFYFRYFWCMPVYARIEPVKEVPDRVRW